MAKEKPLDSATGAAALPGDEAPTPRTVISKPATVVSTGLIGDVATAATDLSDVAPNENEE